MKKISKIISLIFVCVMVSLFVFGCSDSNNLPKLEYGTKNSQSTTSSTNNDAIITTENRLLVYTVDISITVENLDDSIKTIKNKLVEVEGYEQSSLTESNYNYFVYRVPTEKLDEFISSLNGCGQINSKSVKSEDLTDVYESAKTKLESLKNYKQSLEALLEEATTITDKSNIQEKIFKVASEIDSYEKQVSSYKKQSDYSTVKLTIYKKGEKIKENTLLEKIKIVFGGSFESLSNVINAIILSLVAIIPYLLALALCFGLYMLIYLVICKIKRKKFEPFKKKNLKNKDDNLDNINNKQE